MPSGTDDFTSAADEQQAGNPLSTVRQTGEIAVVSSHGNIKLLLIDGFNLVRRIYEARPHPDEAMAEVCEAAAASLKRALRTHRPTHAVVVFEQHDQTWRHLLYPEYKAGRSGTPEALLAALPEMENTFRKSGVPSFSVANYEADDVIATLAVGVAQVSGEAVVLSTDKSCLQLLRPGLRVFNHFEQHEITPESVREKYGVAVGQLVDFWAMAGDPGNHIKGVRGVGGKTAAALLQEFGNLDAILTADSDDRRVVRVQQGASAARICRQLVTLKQDVDLGINLRSFRLAGAV